MLDDDHRIAGLDQTMQDLNQALDVGHVQAYGRFVEYIQCAAFGLASAQGSRLGQFGDQLDALCFATGQRGTGLAEREIAESYVAQQLQGPVYRWLCTEERQRLVDAHCQHVGDAAVLVAYGQGFRVVASAPAHLAGHHYIG